MKQKHEINQTKEKKKQTMESFIQLFLFIFYQVHFHFVVYFSLLHHSFLLVFFLPFIHSVVGLFCVLCFNYITNEWNECVNLIKTNRTQTNRSSVISCAVGSGPLLFISLCLALRLQWTSEAWNEEKGKEERKRKEPWRQPPCEGGTNERNEKSKGKECVLPFSSFISLPFIFLWSFIRFILLTATPVIPGLVCVVFIWFNSTQWTKEARLN